MWKPMTWHARPCSARKYPIHPGGASSVVEAPELHSAEFGESLVLCLVMLDGRDQTRDGYMQGMCPRPSIISLAQQDSLQPGPTTGFSPNPKTQLSYAGHVNSQLWLSVFLGGKRKELHVYAFRSTETEQTLVLLICLWDGGSLRARFSFSLRLSIFLWIWATCPGVDS